MMAYAGIPICFPGGSRFSQNDRVMELEGTYKVI